MNLPPRITVKTTLLFVLKKALLLCVVLIGVGGLVLGFDIAMNPTKPESGEHWVWIEAPKIPILWHRGWWLECHRDTAIHCTLVTGSDHSVVYAGVYAACGPLAADAGLSPVTADHPSDMWVVTKDTAQLAPIVRLEDHTLLVPVSVQSQCAALQSH